MVCMERAASLADSLSFTVSAPYALCGGPANQQKFYVEVVHAKQQAAKVPK